MLDRPKTVGSLLDKAIDSAQRLRAQPAWLATQPEDIRGAAWAEHSSVAAALQAHLHGERMG
jgi:hypothetical protein